MAAEAENIKKYAEQQDIRAAERQQKRKEANAALAQVQQNLAQELEEKQRLVKQILYEYVKTKIPKIRPSRFRSSHDSLAYAYLWIFYKNELTDDPTFRAKEEYENIVQELVLAEQEEKDRMKEIREFEKQLRSKVELQRNHQIQMEYLADRRAAEQAELEAYRE